MAMRSKAAYPDEGVLENLLRHGHTFPTSLLKDQN